MSDTSIPVPACFSKTSKSEQIRHLQDLWDQIAESPPELPVPESHLELAEARLNRFREDPSKARSSFIDRRSKRSK